MGAVASKTNKQMGLSITWQVPTLMCQPFKDRLLDLPPDFRFTSFYVSPYF